MGCVDVNSMSDSGMSIILDEQMVLHRYLLVQRTRTEVAPGIVIRQAGTSCIAHGLC